MSDFDIESLLAPLSEESPCGEDLSYDPAYMELERGIQGQAGHEMGDAVIEAEEPNWREVETQALELLQRTRDLRVQVYLALAWMRRRDLPGLRDGLELMKESLERFWPSLHPELDPDDDNDPMERMNILASMSVLGGFQDPLDFIGRLRKVTLVAAPAVGKFTLRDWEIAKGKMAAPEGMANVPTTGLIAGAFGSAPPEEVQKTAQAAAEAKAALDGMNRFIVQTVGASQAPDISGIEKALNEIAHLFQEMGGTAPEAAPAEAAPAADGAVAAPAAGGAVAGAPVMVQVPAAPPGEVSSRNDVKTAIDKICRYYEKNEPSSPVPLLLRRAHKLVDKDFLEIVKDIVPESVDNIMNLGGIVPEEETEQTY